MGEFQLYKVLAVHSTTAWAMLSPDIAFKYNTINSIQCILYSRGLLVGFKLTFFFQRISPREAVFNSFRHVCMGNATVCSTCQPVSDMGFSHNRSQYFTN